MNPSYRAALNVNQPRQRRQLGALLTSHCGLKMEGLKIMGRLDILIALLMRIPSAINISEWVAESATDALFGINSRDPLNPISSTLIVIRVKWFALWAINCN